MEANPLAASFASTAAAYERGRPEYPSELFEWIGSLVELGPDSVALDLGAGTGKFARGLRDLAGRVVAVEPIEKMRAELVRLVPGVECLAGSAQAIPMPEQSCDLVACAQSFHWFADEEALTEIARVLRPGGVLLLVWNRRDLSDPLQALIEAIQEADAFPGFRATRGDGWQRAISAAGQFQPLEEASFAHRQLTDHETALARVLSTTSVARMDDKARGVVLEQVTALLPPGAKREIPFLTRAYAYRRS